MRISILIFSLLIAFGCTETKKETVTIKFILPNDYTGEITMIPIGPVIENIGTVKVFNIPDNGIIKSESVLCLREWHQLIIQFEDGRIITDYTKDIFNNNGFKFEGGTTSNDGTTKYRLNKIP